MKQIDLFKFKKLVDNNKPFIVKFKSNGCSVCVDLEEDYKKVSELFKQMPFYDVDVNEDEELAEMFVETGVPTIYYVSGKKFKELEYPDDGFDFESLKDEIEKQLKGKDV